MFCLKASGLPYFCLNFVSVPHRYSQFCLNTCFERLIFLEHDWYIRIYDTYLSIMQSFHFLMYNFLYKKQNVHMNHFHTHQMPRFTMSIISYMDVLQLSSKFRQASFHLTITLTCNLPKAHLHKQKFWSFTRKRAIFTVVFMYFLTI